MRILTDFHHSGLLRSLNLLFVNRLGHELYRPIGLEWFTEGFWKINNQQDTAEQFLGMDQAYLPPDGTAPLNQFTGRTETQEGACWVLDPGGQSMHRACTLQFFKDNPFDVLIASIPAHIKPFAELIRLYQPNAKLVFQVGNNWNFDELEGMNVLASTMPRPVKPNCNAIFYHQEIDLKEFYPTTVEPNRNIYSFVNIQQNTGIGWDDFIRLEKMTIGSGFIWKSFGGQCRDGSMHGDRELANKMRQAMMIYHVKPGGDGFGHVIHDAYAVGRPIITRRSHYANQPGGALMVPGTCIDLDEYSLPEVKNVLHRLASAPDLLIEMGKKARARFDELVRYDEEAEAIKVWLENLL
jgi:hypothetical protein